MKDAIVVLGWGIEPDGTLSNLTVQRVKVWSQLLHEWKSKYLVMSGKFGFTLNYTPPRTEAVLMKELAESLWVPSEQIILEEESLDTIGNVFYVKTKVFLEKKWKSAYVVTSDFHISRTEMLFHRIFWPWYLFEYVKAPSWFTPEYLDTLAAREKKIVSITNKWLSGIENGDHLAVENILFSVHPGYAEYPEMSKEDFIRMIYE